MFGSYEQRGASAPHGRLDAPRSEHVPAARLPMDEGASALLPAVHRTQIDGIPVFWADAPGPLQAQLVFGVGMRDESFLTRGITHVIEHLAMRALGDLPYDCNASVDAVSTVFEVAGPSHVVVEHLSRICASLSRLDLTDLDIERKVLLSEERTGGLGTATAVPLAVWFGNRGFGLTGLSELAIDLCSAAEVAAWASRWFHRGNVALALTGPPPADLRLPLPAGDRPARSTAEPTAPSPPGWVEGPDECVLLLLRGDRSAESDAAVGILNRRLRRRMRHETGMAYLLDPCALRVGQDHTLHALCVPLDCADVDRAVALMRTELDALATVGPTFEELDFAAAEVRNALADPRTWIERVQAMAIAEVTGIGLRDEEYVRIALGLSPEAIRRSMQETVASMVLVVPEFHEVPGLDRLQLTPVGPVDGREVRRYPLGSAAPRASRLILGESGISLRLGADGDWQTVLFDDVVGLGIEKKTRRCEDDLFVVTSALGPTIPLRAVDWRGGQAIVDAVRERVPADLLYEVPNRMRWSS